jgi:hypothetical protein
MKLAGLNYAVGEREMSKNQFTEALSLFQRLRNRHGTAKGLSSL